MRKRATRLLEFNTLWLSLSVENRRYIGAQLNRIRRNSRSRLHYLTFTSPVIIGEEGSGAEWEGFVYACFTLIMILGIATTVCLTAYDLIGWLFLRSGFTFISIELGLIWAVVTLAYAVFAVFAEECRGVTLFSEDSSDLQAA